MRTWKMKMLPGVGLLAAGLPLAVSLAATLCAEATVRYVDLNCPSPTQPFTNWTTAATNIQDAIDAAGGGDVVWVTNGVYQTGGKVVAGTSPTNRVAVDKPLMVASVSGPGVTVIQGARTGRVPTRCAYLTNGATLAGFTLTNGTAGIDQGAGQGGGVYCQSAAARLTNCTLTGNSAGSGGGAYQGTLYNCTLRGNSATAGGGAYQATLNNCAVTGNSAASGGGAAYGTLNNCTLTINSASSSGGGVSQAMLNNCILYYNTSPNGTNYTGSTLNYCCTVPLPSGGAGNISADPQLASASHLSAVSPCHAAGSTNYATGVDIDGEPWADAPSIGCDEFWPGNATGPLNVSISASYTNVAVGYAVDFAGAIEGKVWASAWDFGDGVVISNRLSVSHTWTNGGDYTVVLTAYNDEYPTGVSTALIVRVSAQTVFYVSLDSTNPVPPYAEWAMAATDIQSALDLALLPGQSVLVSNGLYQIGGRLVGSTTNRVAVQRAIKVASVNGPDVTIIQGQRATGGGLGADAVRCVYLASGAFLEGFTLSGGATTSYDAGGGAYCASAAARLTNCTLSINFAYLGAGAYSGTLDNCTLRGNSAGAYGGATYQSTLNNCTVDNNACNYDGGGAAYGTLNNCVLTHNRAIAYGGGTRYSTLNNCILRRNLAEYGAGAYYGTLSNCTLEDNYAYSYAGGMLQSTLRNCIVYYNGAPSLPNYSGGSLNYCCTTPDPGFGAGNITTAPLFVDQAGANLHLQTNSPCINAGRNTYAPGTTDPDGNPRISGSTVDIGAYEVQSPASLLSYAWAQQYGLPTDGSADYQDSDVDGMNNWQEWRAGTDPTNSDSVLRLQAPIVALPGLLLRWSSDTNHAYFVERASSLEGPLSFSLLQTNLPGLPGTTAYTDTAAPSLPAAFYRVGSDSANDSSPLNLQLPALFPGSVTLTWSSVATRSYSLERATNVGTSPAFSLLSSNIAGQAGTTSFTDTNAVTGGPPFCRIRVEQ